MSTKPTYEKAKNICSGGDVSDIDFFYKLDGIGTTHMITCYAGEPYSYTQFHKWNSPNTKVSQSYNALLYCNLQPEMYSVKDKDGNFKTFEGYKFDIDRGHQFEPQNKYSNKYGLDLSMCSTSRDFQFIFENNPTSFGSSLIQSSYYQT